ncbi:MAG: hypothetical protein KKB30_13135 [Proteobacteria bacterium]|nr:hypothetical protein [Pseudomonadota bacterium]MBU1716819.1 hypothetical protein [Pseudomonadota bacterium]
MNTQEKIDLAVDPARLYLHKEGIFYTIYNQHAMLFVENIKELKVKCKFVKVVNQDVYSCGFPASIIEEIKQQLVDRKGVVEESAQMVTVTGVNWQTESDYGEWRQQQKNNEDLVEKSSSPNSLDLVREVAGFQVMHRTPMDAMNFIITLQEKITSSYER